VWSPKSSLRRGGFAHRLVAHELVDRELIDLQPSIGILPFFDSHQSSHGVRGHNGFVQA
jgi:hypothetical protein